jgi:hypothetical protein
VRLTEDIVRAFIAHYYEKLEEAAAAGAAGGEVTDADLVCLFTVRVVGAGSPPPPSPQMISSAVFPRPFRTGILQSVTLPFRSREFLGEQHAAVAGCQPPAGQRRTRRRRRRRGESLLRSRIFMIRTEAVAEIPLTFQFISIRFLRVLRRRASGVGCTARRQDGGVGAGAAVPGCATYVGSEQIGACLAAQAAARPRR